MELTLKGGEKCLIDDEDFDLVKGRTWKLRLTRNTRVPRPQTVLTSAGKHKALLIHRVIMDARPGEIVDHANGDVLDNRRANLRKATHAENMRNSRLRVDNTSGFKGVTLNKRIQRWRSEIHVDGRKVHLGHFATKEDANEAYKLAAKQFHGEFARF